MTFSFQPRDGSRSVAAGRTLSATFLHCPATFHVRAFETHRARRRSPERSFDERTDEDEHAATGHSKWLNWRISPCLLMAHLSALTMIAQPASRRRGYCRQHAGHAAVSTFFWCSAIDDGWLNPAQQTVNRSACCLATLFDSTQGFADQRPAATAHAFSLPCVVYYA